MVGKNFTERIQIDMSLAEKIGFNPYYLQIESGLDDQIIIEGKEYINLAANNYLGLATDPRVKKASMEAVAKYGTSLCGTPIATGSIDLYKRVENRLTQFVGVEDSLLLPTGYQANNGLFPAIVRKEDLVLVDHFAHSSLVQGIKMVGCKIRPFLHNDLEHVRRILAQAKGYGQIFIVTESVFSTDGSVAPLKDLELLANEYGAIPIVDDSHGIGVIGQHGRGILDEQKITNFSGIYTASLGKGLANLGGMIGGKKELIEYLRYYCPHLIYSTALPPAVLGGLEKVLDIIETDFAEIGQKLWKYREMIRVALLDAGFEVVHGTAPINSIRTGSVEQTLEVAKKLFDVQILSTPFIAPSVPPNEGRVRLIAGANLRTETIEKAVTLIGKVGVTG